MGQQFTWFVVRASGLVAWGLVTASVVWGLVLAGRWTRRPRPAWVLDLHRFLAALTFVFIGVHLLALWLDSYVQFGPVEMLVPMASTWRPGAVAWGVVALQLLVAVEVTSLVMHRLPRRVWHVVHCASFAVFIASTVHAFAAGADAGHPAMQLSGLVAGALVAGLLVLRVRSRRRRRPVAAPVTTVPVHATS